MREVTAEQEKALLKQAVEIFNKDLHGLGYATDFDYIELWLVSSKIKWMFFRENNESMMEILSKRSGKSGRECARDAVTFRNNPALEHAMINVLTSKSAEEARDVMRYVQANHCMTHAVIFGKVFDSLKARKFFNVAAGFYHVLTDSGVATNDRERYEAVVRRVTGRILNMLGWYTAYDAENCWKWPKPQ